MKILLADLKLKHCKQGLKLKMPFMVFTVALSIPGFVSLVYGHETSGYASIIIALLFTLLILFDKGIDE